MRVLFVHRVDGGSGCRARHLGERIQNSSYVVPRKSDLAMLGEGKGEREAPRKVWALWRILPLYVCHTIFAFSATCQSRPCPSRETVIAYLLTVGMVHCKIYIKGMSEPGGSRI